MMAVINLFVQLVFSNFQFVIQLHCTVFAQTRIFYNGWDIGIGNYCVPDCMSNQSASFIIFIEHSVRPNLEWKSRVSHDIKFELNKNKNGTKNFTLCSAISRAPLIVLWRVTRSSRFLIHISRQLDDIIGKLPTKEWSMSIRWVASRWYGFHEVKSVVGFPVEANVTQKLIMSSIPSPKNKRNTCHKHSV